MKIVVIGGSGLIGKQLVALLRDRGHEVVPASPSSGVDALTGKGLALALKDAAVVVDVANSPSFEPEAALNFFETTSRNLIAAEVAAGVRHHVALSVVGIDRTPGVGYFRAKLAQEALIAASPIPYSIVRATQFFEFLGAIAAGGTIDGTVHLSPVDFQPIASKDVAAILADVAVASPLNGMIEIAGPDRRPLDEFVRKALRAARDTKPIVTDATATYFGTPLNDRTLTPEPTARLGPTRFDAWVDA